MRKANATFARELLLIFDKGDDVSSTLLEFAKRNGISGARFQAIGALREATIAYWNAQTNEYEEIAVSEQVEVVSMLGNLAQSSEGVKMHAHVVLGKRDGSTVGGHFVRGTVYPTLEMFISAGEVPVRREKDAATGLWLLSF